VELVPRPGGFHSSTAALVHAPPWGGVPGPRLHSFSLFPTQVGPDNFLISFSRTFVTSLFRHSGGEFTIGS
jgi:hypothetical protein